MANYEIGVTSFWCRRINRDYFGLRFLGTKWCGLVFWLICARLRPEGFLSLFSWIFQSVYEQTDKFDLAINGWGGEDLKFFETCVNFKVTNIFLFYWQKKWKFMNKNFSSIFIGVWNRDSNILGMRKYVHQIYLRNSILIVAIPCILTLPQQRPFPKVMYRIIWIIVQPQSSQENRSSLDRLGRSWAKGLGSVWRSVRRTRTPDKEPWIVSRILMNSRCLILKQLFSMTRSNIPNIVDSI